MAENWSNEKSGPNETMGPDKGSNHEGMPLWVKVFGFIGIILAVIFVLLHLTGHGLHGHMPPPNHPPSTDAQ